MVDTPTPLTLVFSPEFGAPHLHPDGQVRYHIDRNLAGRIVAFKPVLPGVAPRSMFEIGRHVNCWLRIDRSPELNSEGYSVLNAFSRVHVTFQWMDVERYSWVGESRWFVIPGGVFLGKDGIRESSGAKNGVFLNGARLSDGGNPEPLFQGGGFEANLSLGVYGRIIVMDGLLDDHSTGWDRSRWEGPGWPSTQTDIRNDTGPHERRIQVEGEVVAEKTAQKPISNSPWFVPAILEPGWVWFKAQSPLLQALILVLAACLTALWIVER